jgi:hypothetical protein
MIKNLRKHDKEEKFFREMMIFQKKSIHISLNQINSIMILFLKKIYLPPSNNNIFKIFKIIMIKKTN